MCGLPRLYDHVALVLDTSESMRGYGEREWALLSQAEALRLVLGHVCEHLTVIEVGASQAGPTDLATGLLDALAVPVSEHGLPPGLIAIVTDGYENRLPGDLARVAATLTALGHRTPILLCHAMFTGSDDRALRDPAPNLPSMGFWHQDDFAALLPWLFAHSPAGADWIRTTALRFLARRSENAAA